MTDDVFRHGLQATIEGLRYWVPSVHDLARIAEEDTPSFWRLDVRPGVAGACPFELVLHADGRYDAIVAGEAYQDRPMTSLGMFLPWAQAITDGRVVQRRWVSSSTGALWSVDTLVTLDGGTVWRNGELTASVKPSAAACEAHDRHFLPYRR
jgi:hypothetical protein